jgi:thioredoxin-like negative regulator of GroEL
MLHRLLATDAPEFMRDGIAARQSGDRLAAMRYFKAAATADPKDRQARIELAQELVALGQQVMAEAVLRRLPGKPVLRSKDADREGHLAAA